MIFFAVILKILISLLIQHRDIIFDKAFIKEKVRMTPLLQQKRTRSYSYGEISSRDLGNRASPPSRMNTSQILQRK